MAELTVDERIARLDATVFAREYGALYEQIGAAIAQANIAQPN